MSLHHLVNISSGGLHCHRYVCSCGRVGGMCATKDGAMERHTLHRAEYFEGSVTEPEGNYRQ